MSPNRGTALILALAALVILVPAPGLRGQPADAGRGRLIDFELRDQFDRTYTEETYRGQVLVVLGSDRGGSEFNAPWGRAIWRALDRRNLDHRVHQIGLSDLRGAPWFLRGAIRKRFPRDRDSPILMDWKGVFPEAYDFEKSRSNILVFDAAGRLVHRAAVRELEEATLSTIVVAIVDALADTLADALADAPAPATEPTWSPDGAGTLG